MKIILSLVLLIGLAFSLKAQEVLTYFSQLINIASYQNANFRLEGYLFIEDRAKDAGAVPFGTTLIGNKPIKTFFDKYSMDLFKPGVWNRVSISGKIDKQADNILVGVFLSGKGKFYFDDFKLFIKKSGSEVELPLGNNDFESNSISPWTLSNFKDQFKIKLTSNKFNSGSQSLLIDNSMAESSAYGNNTKVGKFADINGIKLYYEVYGSGEPLLLLHGNGESIVSFSQQIPELSKSYRVIALDSRGQGNSTSDSTKLTYELFANDVNKFLDYLDIKQANILGWSDGGNTALIVALQHPDKVKKLAVTGAVLFNNGTSVQKKINDIFQKQVAEMERANVSKYDMEYRLKKLLLTEPNINPESLTSIHIPALIMAGENDVVKKQHTKLIAKKIPNAKLKIFKKAGHDAPKDVPAEFNKTVLEFFQKKE